MELPRVFFDGNSGPPGPEDLFGLWFEKSLRDLAGIPGGATHGMRIIIYIPDDLEMEAILKFDPLSGRWLAAPIYETIKRY